MKTKVDEYEESFVFEFIIMLIISVFVFQILFNVYSKIHSLNSIQVKDNRVEKIEKFIKHLKGLK